MNEVIAKGLKEQLRVLKKYLEEDYPIELQDILGYCQWLAFSEQIDNASNSIENYLKEGTK